MTPKSTKRPTEQRKKKTLKRKREEDEMSILKSIAKSLKNDESVKESGVTATPNNPNIWYLC